jgi:hypothetical protein
MATYITRYGYSSDITEANFEKVVEDLLEELRTEEYEEPDDEHTQVSIGTEHWSVTAQVSGLITFDNIDLLEGNASELPENMYLRNISDSDLKEIWLAILVNDKKKLLSFNWVKFEQLPEYTIDYYREKA